jgi:penicillin amidase
MIGRALALAGLLAGVAQAAVPVETRTLPGLDAQGEIVVDRWGISHVYAATPRDAFFLQGYAVARDRLWQIDLWRKRGLGRLAASFGPSFVAQDRASRLFLYRGDMAAEWAAYPKEAKGWTEAFAAGINAFVADTEAGRQPLPPEFAATGSKPERWTAEDIVRIRTNALASNLSAEVARARSLCLGGLPWEPLRRKLEPEHQIEVPKGFDPCVITADLLADYTLGTATSVSFDKGKVVALRDDDEGREGSNNWAVAPSRSTTGRAILAGDPHRDHSAPSLRYISHLSAPGLNIAGAGEPALPGISFGHNDDIAWALTIFAIDQQDLMVSPIAEAVTSITETIEVKDAKWQQVTLHFTPAGPVIAEAGRWRFAVRATWDRPGASAYFNASWLFQGKGWQDFLRARDHWGAPPLNLVYADTKGQIGWAAAGFFPDRKGYDGLTPVLEASAWTGLHSPDKLPVIRNPARGWLGSANEFNLPPGSLPTAFEWAGPARMDRITKVLESKPRISLADSMALQNDDHSELARDAVALLKPLPDPAAAMLKNWDGNLAKDSAAAALYEIWASRHLVPAAVAAIVPAEAQPAFAKAEVVAVVDWLTAHPEGRDAILAASLDAAWADAAARMGPDPAQWQWGKIHQAKFVPAVTLPGLEAEQTVGPVPLGGTSSSPKAASHEGGKSGDFTLTAGASVRMVLDVGQWDDSVIINTPGQSGNVASPHYRDLFPLWADGRYVPFLWSRDKVMAAAERVIRAAPAD